MAKFGQVYKITQRIHKHTMPHTSTNL